MPGAERTGRKQRISKASELKHVGYEAAVMTAQCADDFIDVWQLSHTRVPYYVGILTGPVLNIEFRSLNGLPAEQSPTFNLFLLACRWIGAPITIGSNSDLFGTPNTTLDLTLASKNHLQLHRRARSSSSGFHGPSRVGAHEEIQFNGLAEQFWRLRHGK
jgi:hypothetical protein